MRLVATLVLLCVATLFSQYARGQCPTRPPVIERKHNSCFDPNPGAPAANGRITISFTNDREKTMLFELYHANPADPFNINLAQIVSRQEAKGEFTFPVGLLGGPEATAIFSQPGGPGAGVPGSSIFYNPNANGPFFNVVPFGTGELQGRIYLWVVKDPATGQICQLDNYTDFDSRYVYTVPGRGRLMGLIGVRHPVAATLNVTNPLCRNERNGTISVQLTDLYPNNNRRRLTFSLYEDVSDRLVVRDETVTTQENALTFTYTFRNLRGGIGAPLVYRWRVEDRDLVSPMCAVTGFASLLDPGPFEMSASTRDSLNTVHTSCVGAADGIIDPVIFGSNPYAAATANPDVTAGITPATAPANDWAYRYRWARFNDPAPFSFNRRVTGLSAGRYRLTVIDRNNCDTTFDYTVYDPKPLTLQLMNLNNQPLTPAINPGEFNVGNILCNENTDGQDGALRIVVSGGTGTPLAGSAMQPTLNASGDVNGTAAWIPSMRYIRMHRVLATGEEVEYTLNGAVNETGTNLSFLARQVYFSPSTGVSNQHNVYRGRFNNQVSVEFGGNPSNFETNYPATARQSNLPRGRYIVRVWDIKNASVAGAAILRNESCTAKFEFSIVEPSPIVVNYIVDNVTCVNTRAAITNIAQWSNTNTIGSAPTFTASATADSRDGRITLSPFGGQPPYYYRWLMVNPITGNLDTLRNADLTAITTSSVSGLSRGAYRIVVGNGKQTTMNGRVVIVPDGSDCPRFVDVNLGGPEALIANINCIKAPTCFGSSDGELRVSATGGTFRNLAAATAPPRFSYTYTLYNGDWMVLGRKRADNVNSTFNGVVFEGLKAGVYHVEVTDERSCKDTTNRTYTQVVLTNGERYMQLNTAALGANAAYNTCPETAPAQTTGLNPTSINLTATRSSDIVLSFDSNDPDDDGRANGTIANRDFFGDYDTQLINDQLTLLKPVTCFGSLDGLFRITPRYTGTLGANPFVYKLSGGPLQREMIGTELNPNGPNYTGQFSDLGPGTYTVMVAYNTGGMQPMRECFATLEVTIRQPAPIVAEIHADSADCSFDPLNDDQPGRIFGKVYVVTTGGRPFKGPQGTYNKRYNYTWFENGNSLTPDAQALLGDSLILYRPNAATPLPSYDVKPTINPANPRRWSSNIQDASLALINNGLGTNITAPNPAINAAIVARFSNGCEKMTVAAGRGPGSTNANTIGFYPNDTVAWAPAAELTLRMEIVRNVMCNRGNTTFDGQVRQGNEGEVRGIGRGGIPPYRFVLAPNGPNPIGSTRVQLDNNLFTGLGEGTYTYTLFDSRGCSVSSTFQLAEPNKLALNVEVNRNPSDCNVPDGALNFTFTSDIPTAAPLPVTRYLLEISNSGVGEPNFEADVVVTAASANVVDAVGAPIALGAAQKERNSRFFVLGYHALAGNLAATISGTINNLNSSPINGFTTVTIHDLERGCFVQDRETLQPSTTNPITNVFTDEELFNLGLLTQGRVETRSTVSCFGARDGVIAVRQPTLPGGIGSGAGTTPTYTYTWRTSTGQDLSLNPQLIPGVSIERGGLLVRNLPANDYMLTVSVVGGRCTFTKMIRVSNPAPLTYTSTATNVGCNGQITGAFNVTAAGGTAPYRYNIIRRQTANTGLTDTVAFSGTMVSINNLPAAKYDLTIIDSKGCHISRLVEITQPAPFNVAVDTLDGTYRNVSCTGRNDGSAGMKITVDAAAPVRLTWRNSAGEIVHDTTLTAPLSRTTNAPGGIPTTTRFFYWDYKGGLAPGVYTVTGVTAAGCTDVETIRINEATPLRFTTDTKRDALACGTNLNNDVAGRRIVEVQGGNPPYFYRLHNASNNRVIDSVTTNGGNVVFFVPAGTYYVTAYSGREDELARQDNVIIPVNTIPVRQRCMVTSSQITVNEPAAPTIAVTDIVNVTCKGLNNGRARVSATGGGVAGSVIPNTFSYIWRLRPSATAQPDLGSVMSVEMNPRMLVAGHYQVTAINDITNCRADAFIFISEPTDALTSVFTKRNPSCNGFPTGIISVTTSGGTAPYTYEWYVDRNETENNFFPGRERLTEISGPTADRLAPGIYTIEVIDANGCRNTLTDIDVVYPRAIFTQNVQTTDVTCPNGSNGGLRLQILGGVPPYKVTWSRGETRLREQVNVGELQSVELLNITAATYRYTIEDSVGCIYFEDLVVRQPERGQINISTVNIGCTSANDGSATIRVSGGTAPYTSNVIRNGVVIGTFTTATFTVNNLAAGNYTVSVRDRNISTDPQNCLYNANFDILNRPLTTTVTAQNVRCFEPDNARKDGGFTFTTTGGVAPYNYTITNQATGAVSNFVDPGTGSFTTPMNFADGAYTITGRDSRTPSSCAIESVTRTIGMAQLPLSASITVQRGTACRSSLDGRASVAVTGGVSPYTYGWSSGETSPNATRLSAGLQNVTITDGNGCRLIVTATIPQPQSELTVAATVVNVTTCQGNNGRVDLNVTGGVPPYSFSWSNNATSEDVSNLTSGVYSGTITDANGCVKSASFTVTEPAPVVATAVATSPTCNAGNNGSINATVTQGTAPYSFSWTGPGGPYTSEDLSGLRAGTYVGRIVDRNNCVFQTSITVTEPAPIVATLTGNTIECGAANGTVTTEVLGANAPFVFVWSNGQTTKDIENLSNDDYTVTVTDRIGCTTVATAVVEINSNLRLNEVVRSISCNGQTDGAVSLNITGGEQPITINWSNGSTSPNLTNLVAGRYTVTVTDARNCARRRAYTISEPATLTASATKADVTCGGANNGTVTLSVNGGTEPYRFRWSNEATTENLADLAGGTYTVTVTDARGCSATVASIVNAPAPITINVAVTPVGCLTTSVDGAVDLTVDGGVPPYTYAWSNNAETQDVSGLAEGTYAVTVTDATNCSRTSSIAVARNTELEVPIIRITGDTTLCSETASVFLDVENERYGVNSGVRWLWSNGEADKGITVTRAGDYSVTVINACGQRTSRVIRVRRDLLPAQPQITLERNALTASTQGQGVTYQWFRNDLNTRISEAEGGTNRTFNIPETDRDTINFIVRVTTPGGCSAISEGFAAAYVSRGRTISSESLKLYPNPTSGKVVVKGSFGNLRAASVNVYSVEGKLVMSLSKVNVANETLELDLDGLTNGVYTVNVATETSIYVGRVVKQ